MRKLKTLLVLSGLAISVLAGCGTGTKTTSSASDSQSKNPVSEPSSNPTSDAPTSAPTSVPTSTSTSSSSQVVKTLEGIRIEAEPTKKNYYVGDQFDAAGLAVKAVYNTGEEDLASGYQLSGFDSETAGEKTVTVTFMSKTASFKVNVEAVVLTGIEIAAEPTKKTYYAGDAFDAAGLQVKAVYNNGKKEDLAAGAYELSGFDTNVSGAQTITVTYQEKTATFAVTVIGKEGIAVTAPKKVRYAIGDAFDATGLVVAQRFADGTQVPLAEGAYQLSGFDSETVGEKTITVTVGADTAEFKVNVYKADWTDAEKASWYNADPPAEKEVQWIEARSDFRVKRSDFNDYADAIEDIMVPALDDDGKPVMDDAGNPVYKQAWTSYLTTNGKDWSDDVEFLGFAEDSDILQYARWSNDNTNYFRYQVLTIGLDEEGKLLAVTTTCNFPLFGWGKFGQSLFVNQKGGTVMDGMYGLAADYAAYIQLHAPSPSEDGPYFQHGVEYPAIATTDKDAYCFYWNDAADNPYLYANEYSERYNIVDFSLEFGTGKAGADNKETPFLPAQLENIMARYEARSIAHTKETINNIDVYTVELEDNGLAFNIKYYIVGGHICMAFEIVYEESRRIILEQGYLAVIVGVAHLTPALADLLTADYTGQLAMVLEYFIEESGSFPTYLTYVPGHEPSETDGVGTALTQTPDGSLCCQVTAKYNSSKKATYITFLVAAASYFLND